MTEFKCWTVARSGASLTVSGLAPETNFPVKLTGVSKVAKANDGSVYAYKAGTTGPVAKLL